MGTCCLFSVCKCVVWFGKVFLDEIVLGLPGVFAGTPFPSHCIVTGLDTRTRALDRRG